MSHITSDVQRRIRELVEVYVPEPLHLGLTLQEIERLLLVTHQQALIDLESYASRDAATFGDKGYVLETYHSFHAVLNYRVASAIFYLETENPAAKSVARRISEAAKTATGVEINPAAKIGLPFVIDHGVNTVIGETSTIGNDCYFLNDVLLGGRSIKGSKMGRRHPQIGNNVQIAGGVKIIGDVSIGDDVVIEPGAKVTWNVPDSSVVKVICACQVTRKSAGPLPPTVDAIVYDRGEGALFVHGTRLSNVDIYLCENSLSNDNRSQGGTWYDRIGSRLVVRRNTDSLVVCEPPTDAGLLSVRERYEHAAHCLEVACPSGDRSASVYVINSPALKFLARGIAQ